MPRFGKFGKKIHILAKNLSLRLVEGSLEAKSEGLSEKKSKKSEKVIFWGSGAEFPYLGILAQNHIFDHILAKNLSLRLVEGSLEAKTLGPNFHIWAYRMVGLFMSFHCHMEL